jgi:hypothetical protein
MNIHTRGKAGTLAQRRTTRHSTARRLHAWPTGRSVLPSPKYLPTYLHATVDKYSTAAVWRKLGMCGSSGSAGICSCAALKQRRRARAREGLFWQHHESSRVVISEAGMSMLIWDMRDMVNGTDVFAYRGNLLTRRIPTYLL